MEPGETRLPSWHLSHPGGGSGGQVEISWAVSARLTKVKPIAKLACMNLYNLAN